MKEIKEKFEIRKELKKNSGPGLVVYADIPSTGEAHPKQGGGEGRALEKQLSS